MPLTDLDKIFWFRAGLGAVGGAAAELLTGCKFELSASGTYGGACVGGATPDYSTGILLGLFLFLASYYLLRGTVGKKFGKDEQRKIYTTGIGSYAMLFLFTWILLFSLGITYLNL